MVESGELGLDDPIADRLPTDIVALLDSDGYDTRAITVRHLLTHTSGIFDHSSTGSYTEQILADPQYEWTARSQVEMAMEIGEPLAPPGEVFSYSDTGYIVLGMVLEHVTGSSLASAVRTLVGFDALGLGSTWWEIVEAEPEGVPERAHQFYGDIDSFTFAPYYDLYGGGGLVATVGDLATFFGGLFRNRVYTEPGMLETMLTTFDGLTAPPDGAGSIEPGSYRMGLWTREIAGHTTWWHTGFFGTMTVHVPDLDLTIAATVNQNQGPNPFPGIVERVIEIVEG
jgi:D-alanyl-D-alanine carboxypeptidase